MSDFYASTARRARKAHRCHACRQRIEPGSVYLFRAGVQDGDFWTDKRHTACQWLDIAANVLLSAKGDDWSEWTELWWYADNRDALWGWTGDPRREFPAHQHWSALPPSEQARIRQFRLQQETLFRESRRDSIDKLSPWDTRAP